VSGAIFFGFQGQPQQQQRSPSTASTAPASVWRDLNLLVPLGLKDGRSRWQPHNNSNTTQHQQQQRSQPQQHQPSNHTRAGFPIGPAALQQMLSSMPQRPVMNAARAVANDEITIRMLELGLLIEFTNLAFRSAGLCFLSLIFS
jgi:hypothetical protein